MTNLVLTFACCALATFSALASDLGWRAGVAKVKITPDEPVWQSGYASRTRPAEGTRMDIWTKALAFEDAKGRVGVFVTIDISSIIREISDEVFRRVSAKHGFTRDQLVLNSSHTHTGPSFGVPRFYILRQPTFTETDRARIARYTEKLIDSIVLAIDTAMANRRPARISTGTGRVRFAVNRRHNKEGEVPGMFELKGPTDYSVPVLKVENGDGGIDAILFGYSCHPTVLDDYLYSGDYPGFAQAELEKAHPGAVALFFQGTGADQNPLPRRKASLAEQYGKELAAADEQVLSEPMDVRDPELVTRYEELPLALDEPMSLEEMKKLEENPKSKPYVVHWARETSAKIRRGEKLPREYMYPLQYWKIGDQRLFALGGEVGVGYAMRIKERFGFGTFVAGYCNDIKGYMPTPEMWDEGGYEVVESYMAGGHPGPWKRDVTQRILDAVEKIAQ